MKKAKATLLNKFDRKRSYGILEYTRVARLIFYLLCLEINQMTSFEYFTIYRFLSIRLLYIYSRDSLALLAF